MEDLYKYERELYDKGLNLIGGVDEVGRGPLIGSVVAACVVLPKDFVLEGLTDSKKLSEKKRDLFYDIIKEKAIAIGIGIVDEKKIDEVNIYEATKIAMKEAIKNTNIKLDHVLIDAMPLDIDVIVLSGMGTNTILKILSSGKDKLDNIKHIISSNYEKENDLKRQKYNTYF